MVSKAERLQLTGRQENGEQVTGAVSLSFPVGGGACGITVQVVDITTCRKSITVTL